MFRLVAMLFMLYGRHLLHFLPVYNVISKLRFGRDMLGFTLGLPVRPRAYMVSNQQNQPKLLRLILLTMNIAGQRM